MKIYFKYLLLLSTFCLSFSKSFAQSNHWQIVQEPTSINQEERQIVPQKYGTYMLDLASLKKHLANAPAEFTPEAKTNKLIIELPLPNGGFSRFYVYKSSIMEKPLADKYPQIQTFACQGIDDIYANGRIDYTEKGFHGMILSPNGCYFIDPYSKSTTDFYISYYKKDFISKKAFYEEGVLKNSQTPSPNKSPLNNSIPPIQVNKAVNRSNGSQLYTYRIAIAATGEYTTFHGGTVALAISAQITTLNRVTAVYRTELGISFNLIANNTSIIYTNASTDPYTNTSGSSMLGQNQNTLTSIIGSANYDMGHVFSTGGGGVAMLASVCSSSLKAQGVTGSSAPVGDPFDIDYVAHEMGHQFGGNHTFNGSTGSCSGGNRNASTAYEPGSGSTIMAYAGICSPQNLQPNSDPYFHTVNFDEIITNITTGATGSTGCAVITSTGNNPPTATVNSLSNTIPKGTPFILNGSATDPNGDPLTYYWEQFDLGSASAPGTPPKPGPRFRSYSPTTSSARIIPNYSNLLAGTTPIGEILPTASQTTKFRLTARDNQSIGGGVDYDVNYSTITFASSGPFTVNSVGTVPPNSNYTVTWNVNGTNASPVNCANVDILLSTDNGSNYGYTLISSTSNDGSETITIPNITCDSARILIQASNNIFFNISNSFVIGMPPPPTISSFTPTLGFPGDTIIIDGTNLLSTTSVSLGGTLTNFIINSNTKLFAIVGIGSTGSVEVVTPYGSATLPGFTLGDSTMGKYTNIGTGNTLLASTSYPAPYGNYYGGARHQIIYLASELTAQGLTAGLISQFGLNVSSLISGSLTGFNIKMGATSLNVLTTTFIASGLTQVYTSSSYTAKTGWNMHNFSTPFYWNGTSNIIVEICFTNNNTGVSGNTVTVATSGLSNGICAYFRADNSSTVCANATASFLTTSRPNGRFFVTRVPLTNASNMQFSNITNTSLTLSFTKGSGGARIIVCRPTLAAAVAPVNLTNYNANSIYSQGNATGASNFVVYNGTNNTVNVTGLTKNTAYTFTVYEFNGAVGNTAYQTLGYSGSPVTTLPVRWQSFEATRNTKSVTLSWATASEVNNDYFTVERSLNNQNWFEQINIKGSGNSTITNKYNYIDNLDASINNFDLYYRIKQVDFDGKFSLSKTLIVKTNTNDINNKVIPNPNNGKFIYFSQEPVLQSGELKIINSQGSEVGKLIINNTETPIDISNLPKGVYYLIFNNNGNSFKTTVVIQ